MKMLLTLVAAVFMGVVSAFATEIEWCGADGGDWAVGDNWTGGEVPTAADTAVFDPGADTTLNVTFNDIQNVCGVKVLSGTVVLGVKDVTKKYLLMNGDADNVSEVSVADGATLRINCGLLPAAPNVTVFKKSGAGTLGFYGPLGDANAWMGSSRQGYARLDFAGGMVTTYKDGTIFYSTNAIIRAGATWCFSNYNTMLNGYPYLYIEKGGVLVPYNSQDYFRGVEGEGEICPADSAKGMLLSLEGGPYRFDGKIGNTTSSSGSFNLVFGAQGSLSDEEYGFIVGNTNVISGLSSITYSAEPSPRAVTNCPIRFAAGIGRFNFYVLNCKKGAPLVLEDINGDPVDVYAENLGDNNGKFLNSEFFAVAGKGNFYVHHSPGLFRRWEIPFTNNCFRSTGTIGSYDTGAMTFGDGTEGHDPDLSTVSRIIARDAMSKVTFNNFGALSVPGLEINGTFAQNAGAGDLTVAGAATGSGTYTLDAPTTFDGSVSISGTMVINTNVTYNGSVSGGQFTVKAETAFNGPVEGGKFIINKPATFADEVKGGTYTISAETTFEDSVRGATFTISAPTEFAGETEVRGTFEVGAPTKLAKLVTGEDNVILVRTGDGLLLGADGKEGWISKSETKQPKAGELVFSNGFFHAAYETDAYSKLDVLRPGFFSVSHPKVRVVDADVRVKGYLSDFTDLTVGPGGVFYQYDSYTTGSGSITLDGGDYRIYLRQSYGHDWIVRDDYAGGWTFGVTERGGRISDYTWQLRGNDYVRPELRASFASAAAEGHTPGVLTLAFHNKINLFHKIVTGGPLYLESGYFTPNENAAIAKDYSDGTFFGTNDLILGCCTINFGEKTSDLAPAFAAHGQKLVLAAPAMIVGRNSGKTAQTFAFGDGVSSPFVFEKGSCLVLSDGQTSTAHFDGTGVKAQVKGSKAEVDPATGILRDPVFGSSFFEGGGGADFYRFDFLTQDGDGFLKYDEGVYTEGVEGGADTVARLSTDNATLSANAQVAALNLDARSLTIEEGATLKVGKDDTVHPAVILTHTTDGWGSQCKFGNVTGAGTLDFGKSEGLILAGRSTRDFASCSVSCRITGEGGLSLCGVSRIEPGAGMLNLGGDNDYEGGTRVGGIDVRLWSAGALSTGPVRIAGGAYNGGRVRFCTAATYANEWFVAGEGPYIYGVTGSSPGCLVFNADVTLTGPVHVERLARFSTSPAGLNMSMNYSSHVSGTGVFAGEISGGEVEVLGGHPADTVKKPIVFAHHNSYTGGTRIAFQDLVLRGEGDCGTGKVTMSNGATLTFENDAAKVFPNVIEGKGTVMLAGSGAVSFPNGVKHESWCDIRLDVGGTAPVFAGDIPFATVTNTAVKAATITLTTDSKIDPSWQTIDPNVNLVIADGRTLDLCGGTLTVRRLTGGTVVNGEIVQTKPAQGLLLIVR